MQNSTFRQNNIFFAKKILKFDQSKPFMAELVKLSRKLKKRHIYGLRFLIAVRCSNFANFGSVPQTQFLIYIFLNVTAIKNRRPYICLFFSLRDNLTSSSINGLLWSNFKILFAKKMLFSSKSTILHIFDFFEDHTTKKKFVTRDVTNFSPIMHNSRYLMREIQFMIKL